MPMFTKKVSKKNRDRRLILLKKEYTQPEIKIVSITFADIITESDPTIETPQWPFSTPAGNPEFSPCKNLQSEAKYAII